MAEAFAQDDPLDVPSKLLLVSGCSGVLYGVLYLGWTAVPTLTGSFAVVAIFSEDGAIDAGKAALFFLTIPVLQLVGYGLCTALGLLTLYGSIQMRQARRIGIAYLGLAASVATPVLGLVVTLMSVINVGSCGLGIFGCLFGNVGSLLLLGYGMIAGVWGMSVLTGPAADLFDA